ncbi:tyrosine-type recombinase/integrase [Eubacterium limosum]|uniref:tyrosine-type recombinase/integrase n=1 Tax=Eubacterium limosum TaxID=1736 RepID=UPI00371FBA63
MKIYELESKFEDFKYFLEDKYLAPGSIKKYIVDVSQFIDYLKDNTNSDKELLRSDVYAYRNLLFEKYKVTTANGKIISLNQFLKFVGIEDFLIRQKRIQTKSNLNNVISIKEYQTLLRWAKKKNDHGKLYLVFRSLASTGMRVSELKHLTLRCVNKGYIESMESKGKIKDIPLPGNLCKELKSYCDEVGVTSLDVPVLQTRHGRPLDERYIWRVMREIGGKARIPLTHLHPHSLRHLFGKRYNEVYGDLSTLADILGHSSLQTTRIYTMSSVKEKRKQMDELGL